VQVFIPTADNKMTAKILDYRRLGKQRVECFQILNAIKQRQSNDTHDGTRTRGWVNHPCTIMWESYPQFLIDYASTICKEWRARGYTDNMLPRFDLLREEFSDNIIVPPWWGNEELHRSHQSRLLQKNFDHYSKWFDNNIPLTLDYIWMQ